MEVNEGLFHFVSFLAIFFCSFANNHTHEIKVWMAVVCLLETGIMVALALKSTFMFFVACA